MRFNPDEYISVHERIEKFYAQFPMGRINTTILENNFETGFVLVRAEVYREAEDTLPAATGHAYEVRGGNAANATSHVENAETSAVGRALALLGFEVRRGIASREEMQKAARMPTETRTAPRTASPADDAQLVEDSMNILEAADKLGYDGTQVKKWINQKYQVTEGINSLTPHDRKEVLGIFRAQANTRTSDVPAERESHLAVSLADLITPKQLGMVRALARERELDPDEECQRVFGCNTEELSKRSASSFIDHLKEKDVVTS